MEKYKLELGSDEKEIKKLHQPGKENSLGYSMTKNQG